MKTQDFFCKIKYYKGRGGRTKIVKYFFINVEIMLT